MLHNSLEGYNGYSAAKAESRVVSARPPSEVVKGVVHDLCNTLMGIHGLCALARKQADAGTAANVYLSTLAEETQRALTLVRQLKHNAAADSFKPEYLDRGEVVAALRSAISQHLGPTIALTLRRPCRPTPTRVDPDLIYRLCVNLAVNARDAMEGHGALTVSVNTVVVGHDRRGWPRANATASPYPAAGTYVALSVRDTGCGMDAATRAQALRGGFTTKGLRGGSGLGLTVVQSIVALHRGHLVLKSAPGRGTTVVVLVPRTPDPARPS
jgi:signal transduction histidine kinase